MKKIISVFMILLTLSVFTLTANAKGVYVDDKADLLTSAEEATLTERIQHISSLYNVDIVLHTTMSVGDLDIASYSEEYYTMNGFSADGGLAFVINLNNNEVGNRDFYTHCEGSVYNTFGYDAYDSDYGYINEQVLPYLSDENYYEAFSVYLEHTEKYLSGEYEYVEIGAYDGDYSETGNYSSSNTELPKVVKEVIVIGIGLVTALIVVMIMKSKMNTAAIKTEASDYIKPGSLKLTRSMDIFTHRHVTKTPKPKDNTKSSGGFSSGGSSGGFSSGKSSGGGGGKF